jgi:hypothetical protein
MKHNIHEKRIASKGSRPLLDEFIDDLLHFYVILRQLIE